MQIPILSGIYTNTDSDFRVAYPKNMMPIPLSTGISKGFLRPAEGIVSWGTGPGIDRGGINWNDECYRVMGTSLVKITSGGGITTLGAVAGSEQVSMTYSFDQIAITGGGNLYYWDGSTMTQVTDTDLGTALDVIWVDGYFMTTDGENIVVTELNDPTSVQTLKYGSSEYSPDPIVALFKIHSEVYVVNRYTTEIFQNVGGTGFPFQRVEGAQIMRGAVSKTCACRYSDRIAFIGSGDNEDVAIYIGTSGRSVKISTYEIDIILKSYTIAELEPAKVESRIYRGTELLYVHLPNQTFVYDAASSQALGQPVWYKLVSTAKTIDEKYRAQNFVRCYDKWIVGDPNTNAYGYMTDSLSSHYGDTVTWDFSTQIVYNEGRGAIFHELELVCLTGNIALGVDPSIWTQYTLDGQSWSMEKQRNLGTIGDRATRVNWLQQGNMRHWRVQRFRGTSESHLTVARLEARMEPLYV